MSHTSSDQTYYFVPLGRERGGYLDFLDLPFNATEGQAKERETQYRDRIESEKRTRMTWLTTSVTYRELHSKLLKNELTEQEYATRFEKLRARFVDSNRSLRKLDARLKKGELAQAEYDAQIAEIAAQFEALQGEADSTQITKEEANVQIEQLEKDENEKLEHMNRLNQDYQVMLAKRRELQQKGLVDENIAWLEVFQSTESQEDQQRFWQLTLTAGMLPQAESDSNQPGPSSELSAVRRMVRRYMLRHLRAADALWSSVRGTNRTLWEEKVRVWAAEIRALGPTFDLYAEGAHTATPEFPALSTPISRVIERLESEHVEDLEQHPNRRNAQPYNLAARLAELLRGARVPEQERDEQPDSAADALSPSDAEALEELLRQLAGLAPTET
jgi:hypothetical protein